MSELVRTVVLRLVEDPSQVQVTEKVDGSVVTVEVRVAPEDMGRVIGKGGRVINAIRTIAKVAATKENVKVFVEVV
ncbi:MAG: KH domain-containing protein [Tissierellia bacterium]|nr:KH domain-containing protein [Bacillota bacterium]NLL22218.1 KH domain-containing protein [Tissierellia bacterium]